MNFYEILKVTINASDAEIKKSYQELARHCHPDKSSDSSSHDSFLKLREAWNVLGDARSRKEYDDQLKRDQLYQQFPISEELFIEDLEYSSEKDIYSHTCRCGGCYEITKHDATSAKEREIAVVCTNCSLAIIVILNLDEHTGT